jgi:septum site-determining protein MinD
MLMAKIISVHSFRGGTGKSNITANLAALATLSGKRVGVIDTDIQSPGIHVVFGLKGEEIKRSLNDYLWHNMDIEQIPMDVSDCVGEKLKGKLFLIPSSIKPGEISHVLREGYDAQKLTRGLRRIVEHLNLDLLLIDTHPGLNEETLLSLVISHTLLVVMRPDKQDYEGTGVTIAVARQLNVPRMMIVINKMPDSFDSATTRKEVEAAYNCPVAAVFPHTDQMMTLASAGIFSLLYPEHPLTALYQQTCDQL